MARGTTEVMYRAGHAQEFLDGPRDQLGLLAKNRQLIRVGHQVVHGVRDGVASGLVAGDDEQQEVVAEVACIDSNAVGRLGVDQHGHEVGAIATLTAPRELVAVLEHLKCCRRTEREIAVHLALGAIGENIGVLGILVADHLVAPLDQLGDVGLGNIEQLCQNANRKISRDIGDEVELILGECAVKCRRGDTAKEGLIASERAGGELRLQHLAQGAVARAVSFQNRLADFELAGVELLEIGRADLAGVGLGIAKHVDDVVVASDRPEAVVRSLFHVPVDRRVLAKVFEDLPGGAIGEEAQVGQGDIGQRAHESSGTQDRSGPNYLSTVDRCGDSCEVLPDFGQ